MPAPPHPQETARLARLDAHNVVGTPRENRFDRVVFMAAQILKTPISLISLVTADRQWFKAKVGISLTETAREDAFCAHTILQPGVLIVEDAREDWRFAENPYVVGAPFIRFYAGVPLLSTDGLPLGSLCVVDRQARHVTKDQLRSLIELGRSAEEMIATFDPLDAH